MMCVMWFFFLKLSKNLVFFKQICLTILVWFMVIRFHLIDMEYVVKIIKIKMSRFLDNIKKKNYNTLHIEYEYLNKL